MAEKVRSDKFPGIWLPAGVEVRDVHDGRKVSAYIEPNAIPTLIDTEDVPVDIDHVIDLRDSIAKGVKKGDRSGQDSPVTLAEVAEHPTYPITDGFHRIPAVTEAGGELWAVILLGSSWEEVMDKRILATTTHRGVKFARLVEWIDRAWGLTEWATTTELKPEQACNMVLNPDMTGKTFGISPEMAEEIKHWIQDKSEYWQLTPSQIKEYLVTARVVDPEIVKEARAPEDAKRYGSVTPPQLKIIGGILPNDYTRQRIVAQLAGKERLSAVDTQMAASLLTRIKEDTLEEVVETLKTETWRTALSTAADVGPYYVPHRWRGSSRIRAKAPSSKELMQMLYMAELRFAKASLENLILRGRYIAPPVSHPSDEEPVFQPRLPEVYQGRGNESSWTLELIQRFKDAMDSLDDETIGWLGREGFKRKEAEIIRETAKQRLLDDIRQGGLQFVPIENKALIARLLGICVQHEARQKQESATTIVQEESIGELGRPTTPDDRVLTTNVIQTILPELDTTNRQILLLGALFNLSAFTVAQVVRADEEYVANTFTRLHKRLRSRMVPRQQAAKQIEQFKDETLSTEPSIANLTLTERRIVQLVALQFNDEDIAQALSTSTVDIANRIDQIIEKTGVHSKPDLVDLAYEQGILASAIESE